MFKKLFLLTVGLISYHASTYTMVGKIWSLATTGIHHYLATYDCIRNGLYNVTSHYDRNLQESNYLANLLEADPITWQWVRECLNTPANPFGMPFKSVKISPLKSTIELSSLRAFGPGNTTLVIPQYFWTVPSIGEGELHKPIFTYNKTQIEQFGKITIPDMIRQQKELQSKENLSDLEKISLKNYTQQLNMLKSMLFGQASSAYYHDTYCKGAFSLAVCGIGQFITHTCMKNYSQCINKNVGTKIGFGLLHGLIYTFVANAYSRHLVFNADRCTIDKESAALYLRTREELQKKFATQIFGFSGQKYNQRIRLLTLFKPEPSYSERIEKLVTI